VKVSAYLEPVSRSSIDVLPFEGRVTLIVSSNETYQLFPLNMDANILYIVKGKHT